MRPYDHKKVEKKWQAYWDKKKLNAARDGDKRPKFYGLIEFPFPSGEGLHVGHPRPYIGMDVIARKRRAEGFNVLYPIGWDAFGLPTENYAIKTNTQPAIVTKKNTDNFRRQIKQLAISFDWSREINTTDPKYYKWTQWIFLQLLKHGLAYKKKMAVNWCPKDLIGLANEEVVDGKCERCGTPVEKREREQWMLAITKYAERLDQDLDTVDYLEKVKIQQRNWIGKSEGAEIEFALKPETEPTFYQFFEPGKIKEGEPFVERNAVLAIVKHWKEDKYLGLKWKKVDWETFVTGGVEKGQTAEEAAMAEIREETGYKNVQLAKKLGKMHSRFFHVPKNQNRYAHFDVFHFELKDGKRAELTAEEKANHEPVWLTKEEIANFGLPSSHRHAWDLLQNGGKPPEQKVKVFTTRPDTIFGATYLVLSPEHPLVSHFIHQASNAGEIDSYIKAAAKKTEMDRSADTKEKTGVELKGVKAINPANGEEIPVFIADYVLAGYGTGAIMAVPAHDERDFAFAKKFNLPIREAVVPNVIDKRNPPVAGKKNVERKNVHPIVLDPKTGKYLGIRWKKHPWTTFPMGGMEEGEDPVAAARREVAEETGYTNLKLIKVLPGTVRAEYFAAHKDQNRISYTTAVMFELAGMERNEIKPEEAEAHEVIWLSAADLKSDLMTHAEMGLWNEKMKPGYENYTGEGYLINSSAWGGNGSYLIVEKSLPKNSEAGLKKFGTLSVEKTDKDWGKFYRLSVSKTDEPALLEYLKNNLLKKSEDGGSWYADSMGTTNYTVFNGKIFHITDQSAYDEYVRYGLSVGVPKNQLEFELTKGFDGMTSEEAKKKIVQAVGGKIVTTFKLRDWVFSRQRYWGEPIPVVHCPDCGIVPVPEKDLPVVLPKVKEFKPTESGESPLAKAEKWLKVKCPKCKGWARRETDVMPNWAGSSWYYLRYTDPKNSKALASPKNLKHWTPVDWYNGGMEHTTLHLLYSRFWHKFLFDIGIVPTSEPYMKRTSHGLILAEGGVKMSKSKGNVVNPDDIVKLYGADTLRVYEMFMGPFDQPVAWSTESIIGSRRFVEKIWRLAERVPAPMKNSRKNRAAEAAPANKTLESLVEKTVKKVSEDIEAMHFNTAISALMILVNEMEKSQEIPRGTYQKLLQLSAPFAPHIADELWTGLGNKQSIHLAEWPVADESKMQAEETKIMIQVNGKVRGEMNIPSGMAEKEVTEKALAQEGVGKWIEGKKIIKTIYVKGRLVNFVAQ